MVPALVKNVTEEQIDKARSQLPFGRMIRVLIEGDNAIIKIIPGLKHEIVGDIFSTEVRFDIAMIPGYDRLLVIGVGSTTFHCPGKRSKKGDKGFKCSSRLDKGIEWPNLMIEVGYSEPLSHLRLDAEWWLRNSTGFTRMVDIILISDDPKLDIEVWELRPNLGCQTPIRTNQLQIDSTGNVDPANTSLIISYTVFFDNDHPSVLDSRKSRILFSTNHNPANASHHSLRYPFR